MSYSSFLKKLQVFGALFGSKAKKLSGVQDKNNKITDSITFTAPNLIALTGPVPIFLVPQTYFRVKSGGGANQDVLFRVLSISGNTITVDNTNFVVNFGPGTATLDSRLAVVHNNPAISLLSPQGNTIFNADNDGVTTGLEDGNLGNVFVDHYHGNHPPAPGDVSGPGSSTDKAIARWNGITGEFLNDSKTKVQDSGAIEAQAFITRRNVTDAVTVGAGQTWVSPSIVVELTGSIVVDADGEIIIV